MQPQAISESIQANLSEIGTDKPLNSWTSSLCSQHIETAQRCRIHGISTVNPGMPTQEPTSPMLRCFLSENAPPRGYNWDYFSIPETDRALHETRETFEPHAFNQTFARVHELEQNKLSLSMTRPLEHFRQNWMVSFNLIVGLLILARCRSNTAPVQKLQY